MPHKHKRHKTSDFSSYDLPPTSLAKALPAKNFLTPESSARSQKSGQHNVKRSKQNEDTPRAFTRLLAFKEGQKSRSGLDHGLPRKKPRGSTSSSTAKPTLIPSSATTPLQRLPHESMSAFSQRVNAALPISGLSKSRSGSDGRALLKGLRASGTKQTRMETKMQRMQKEWRDAKRRRDQAMQDEDEEEEEKAEHLAGEVGKASKTAPFSKKSSKATKRRRKQMDGDDVEDPWAELNAHKRASEPPAQSTSSEKGLVGLHDVVVAPPKLSALRAVFKDMTRDIPKVAGSLRRREELAKARAEILSALKKKGHPPRVEMIKDES